jgi:FkbM family methyltransferase
LQPFFQEAKGVIHVGAHFGEEILTYAQHGVNVLWIEANPFLMPRLMLNLRGFIKQRALLALVGSDARTERNFFISNNDGASSSVYALKEHEVIWPEVKMINQLSLQQKTLPQVLRDENILADDYDILVLDVQGAELDILKGIPNLRTQFSRIELEAADFPAYSGCAVRFGSAQVIKRVSVRKSKCNTIAFRNILP